MLRDETISGHTPYDTKVLHFPPTVTKELRATASQPTQGLGWALGVDGGGGDGSTDIKGGILSETGATAHEQTSQCKF